MFSRIKDLIQLKNKEKHILKLKRLRRTIEVFI
jgi:hypothetical protein